MTRPSLLLLAVLVASAGAGVWLAAAVERAPVARSRLERFARRHQVVVTASNGNQLLISYLAITRRWRATGLAAGVAASAGWAATHHMLRIDFLAIFAGWFAGALVAEARLARAAFGPRRIASLTPRNPVAYLPRTTWALLPAAATASLALGVVTLVAQLRGQPVGEAAWVLLVAAMLIAVTVRVVQLRVLRRPQPVAEPDILAADDAIRSRSLHVLAGGGATLTLYCVLGQLVALSPGLPDAGRAAVGVANVLGVLLVPLLGWSVATARWPVRHGPPPTSALPAGSAP